MDTVPQVGRVEWLGLRPERRATISVVECVSASPNEGLEGDRYNGRTGNRHATLIQAEHLPVIANCIGREEVAPHLLRRNIVVRGINLLALKDKVIRIGDAELAVTGLCHPCSRMEELLGPGGYNAVRGHGGVTARVLRSGEICLGDSVRIR
ncbi:MAG: MOSC domain-containing protein [Woeseiaceae bacterium]